MQRPGQKRTGVPAEHGPAWQNQVLEWLNRYRRHLLLAAAGVLLLLLVTQRYRSMARTERTESWRALSQVRAITPPPDAADPEAARAGLVADACQRILNERWKTDATPWVLLEMAIAQGKAGDSKGALASYRRLQEEYKGHSAAGFAAAGFAAALEDEGRVEEAAAVYKRLASERGGDGLFWLDVGRCLELAGDRDGAVGAYERIALAEPEGADGPPERAAWRLERLKAGAPLLKPVPPEPAPQAPETGTGPIIEPGKTKGTGTGPDRAIMPGPGGGESTPGGTRGPGPDAAPGEGQPRQDAGEAGTPR